MSLTETFLRFWHTMCQVMRVLQLPLPFPSERNVTQKKNLNRCRSPKLGICHLLCPTKPFKPFGQKAEKRDKVFTFLLGPPDDHLFAASYWSTSWSSSFSCKLLRCQKRFVHYSLTFIKQLSICHCHCLVKQILNPMNNWFSRAKIKLKTFFEI